MQQIKQGINYCYKKENNASEKIYQMVRENKILSTIRPWQKVIKRKRDTDVSQREKRKKTGDDIKKRWAR